MAPSADEVFGAYKNYVSELQYAMSTLPSGSVADNYRVRLLSFEEFSSVWTGWSFLPGLQEEWGKRFRHGYGADSCSIRHRFQAGLAKRVGDRAAA